MEISKEIEKSLISCIVSRKGGIPLHELNDDFKDLTGYSIPFLSLGHPNLLSYLSSIKYIYFTTDEENNDIVIADSYKSRYMKRLVEKQKPIMKRKLDNSTDLDCTISSINSQTHRFKKRKTLLNKEIMDFLTPIVYGYQLLGDDIFLEVAENHLMVSMSDTAPKRCGLCISGQTIKDLLDNFELQIVLPFRVAILIGVADILNNKSIKDIINDMHLLITELNNRKIKTVLFTIPKLNCIPKNFYSTLRTFNNYILSQCETDFTSVVNMEQFYTWMMSNEIITINKKTHHLLHPIERNIILAGLQDYLLLIKNNYE